VTRLDLAIFCYALTREKLVDGLELESVRRLAPGRHEVVFRDPVGVVSKLELELANGQGHDGAARWGRAILDAQRNLKAIMRLADEPAEAMERHARSGKG
jgi:hypothetical protein